MEELREIPRGPLARGLPVVHVPLLRHIFMAEILNSLRTLRILRRSRFQEAHATSSYDTRLLTALPGGKQTWQELLTNMTSLAASICIAIYAALRVFHVLICCCLSMVNLKQNLIGQTIKGFSNGRQNAEEVIHFYDRRPHV